MKLIIKPAAQREFDQAVAWYRSQSTRVATRFHTSVLGLFTRITQHPKHYAVEWRDIREALVRSFPYAIYFRATADLITVYSVFHTSRDPEDWQARVDAS
jgi:plasmid stabilization system protein ParE